MRICCQCNKLTDRFRDNRAKCRDCEILNSKTRISKLPPVTEEKECIKCHEMTIEFEKGRNVCDICLKEQKKEINIKKWEERNPGKEYSSRKDRNGICVSCNENQSMKQRTICDKCCSKKRAEKMKEIEALCQSKICTQCNILTNNFRGTRAKCRDCEASISRKNRAKRMALPYRKTEKECTRCKVVTDRFQRGRNICKSCLVIQSREIRHRNGATAKPHSPNNYRNPKDPSTMDMCNDCGSRENKRPKKSRICHKCDYIRKAAKGVSLETQLKRNLRTRMREYIKGETGKFKYLGESFDFVREWLEFNFDEQMTWDNYGSYWHIDHIRPCFSFDLENNDDKYECFSWKNIRPLEKTENIRKGSKIDNEAIKQYEKRVIEFIEFKSK